MSADWLREQLEKRDRLGFYQTAEIDARKVADVLKSLSKGDVGIGGIMRSLWPEATAEERLTMHADHLRTCSWHETYDEEFALKQAELEHIRMRAFQMWRDDR